jgi:hypothetical protein
MTKHAIFAAPSVLALTLCSITVSTVPAAANTKLDAARMECRYLIQTGKTGGASDAAKARFKQCVQQRMKKK